ncbi:Uncharacterised protein [uncultured archaeon]|nr:Uncharacterised protein [uncultured archaeon]
MRNSIIVFFIVMLISSTQIIPNPQNNVSALTIVPNIQPTQPNTTFTNVSVDANPIPQRPFKITAMLHTVADGANLLATLSVTDGVSVRSPIVVNLPPNRLGSDRQASWTIIASSAGTYPMDITVYTDNPSENISFHVNVVVGTSKSLVVTGVNIPGNIVPNNNFTVSVTLQNTAVIPDKNVMGQISVPTGLQLLDNVYSTITSIDPGQQATLSWKLKAETAGSHLVIINYTSINSGPDFLTANVNVGTLLVPTGALISIVAHPATLAPNSVTPVLFDFTNNCVEHLSNLQIVSASGGGYSSTNTPIWIGDLGIHATKSVVLKIYPTNSTLSLQIPIAVKYDAYGTSLSETYQTGIPLENLPDFKINSVMDSPTLVYPGDTAVKIDVLLFNLGLGANDVYTTLNLPHDLSPAWGNATTTYFGRINTFQTVTASFYINVDSHAVSGNYPLTLSIVAGNQVTKLPVNFVVSPTAQFQLVSVDDSQLFPGANGVPFKAIIKNTGSITAQTVTTKLLAGNALPGVKSSTITTVGNIENIGNVLPGQTFTTTFFVNLEPTLASGDQSNSLEIDWSQNSTSPSNPFVQTLTVPYHVAQGPSYMLYYGAIPWLYIIIAVAFAVGLPIFIKMRRKRIQTLDLAALQDRAVRRGEFAPTEFEPLQDLSQEIPDDDNLKTKDKVLPKSSRKSIGKDEDMS